MQTSDDQPITLLELAQAILALPPEQQAQKARYCMRDDRGYEAYEPVFGVEVDRDGDVAIEGVDHS